MSLLFANGNRPPDIAGGLAVSAAPHQLLHDVCDASRARKKQTEKNLNHCFDLLLEMIRMASDSYGETDTDFVLVFGRRQQGRFDTLKRAASKNERMSGRSNAKWRRVFLRRLRAQHSHWRALNAVAVARGCGRSPALWRRTGRRFLARTQYR